MKLTKEELELLHKHLFHLLTTYTDLPKGERTKIKKLLAKIANTPRVKSTKNKLQKYIDA